MLTMTSQKVIDPPTAKGVKFPKSYVKLYENIIFIAVLDFATRR